MVDHLCACALCIDRLLYAHAIQSIPESKWIKSMNGVSGLRLSNTALAQFSQSRSHATHAQAGNLCKLI